MSVDLSRLLREWPYESGQINVRLVQGDDGEPKVQMRLDLGILQMETTGRPDGQSPHGCESLLEYHEQRIDDSLLADEDELEDPLIPPPDDEGPLEGETLLDGSNDATEMLTEPSPTGEVAGGSAEAPGASPGDDDPDPPALMEDDCRLLREEAVQYYHRYISLLVLGDYDGVFRDTTRNLRVLDLCRDHAEGEEDRDVLEQFRPYITMMRTRALASQLVADDEPKAALVVIDHGIEELRRLFESASRGADFEGAAEADILRSMREELVRKLPAGQKAELHDRLRRAIETENYELAAILRDELNMLRDDKPGA